MYTKTELGLRLSSLVGSAPYILNTSVERAGAIGTGQNYATTIQHQIHTTCDTLSTYSKVDVNVCVSMLEAGTHRQVEIHVVGSDGKLKTNAVSDDTLKTQKVDGSMLYDSCELAFNPVDKRSILKINNVDNLQSINTNDVAVNVNSKSEIDIGSNLKPYKLNTYSKVDVNVFLFLNYFGS